MIMTLISCTEEALNDEEMSIEKIDGPIGEVTIKGKILTVESREIRKRKDHHYVCGH